MRSNILAAILLLSMPFNIKVLAQSDVSLATHWYNRANYNPASIVRTEYLYLFSNIRQQWFGLNGAPKVFNIQGSEYIDKMNSAFGLSLLGEKIGLLKVYNPMLSYGYRMSNDRSWSLAMGVSAGFFARFTDGSQFEAETLTDPAIYYSIEKEISPDANVGVEFQSVNFICSISSTHLFSINKSYSTLLNTNHRYLVLIYKNTNPDLFNYHVGVQIVNRYNLTVMEGNLSIRLKTPTGLVSGPKEIFDFGLSFNTSQQVTMMFGMKITSNIRLGYAYEQSFIKGIYQNGSHELMLEIRIPTAIASTKSHYENQTYWYY